MEGKMLLVDVHAHLDIFGGEEEVAAAVERAAATGVKAIVTAGVDAASNRKALEMRQRFPIVKAALGLYPAEAAKLAEAEINGELDFIRSNRNKIAAIGEIGLDYMEAKDETDKEKQQKLFETQLGLAKQIGKPVIVHSRQAEKEVVETLIRCGCKAVVLHAFHGSLSLAKSAANSGFFITIPTNIGRSSQFRAIAKALPLSRLLTETDSPFLAAMKEQKSEPADVAAAIRAIAEIKGLDAGETANVVFANYQRLFA
ncbi:TatD family hydrolase [Candidatus Woesearchaeota archaeon]|nr:TatD family hydrolase [Candidatus Woesearchaeota archaeon]